MKPMDKTITLEEGIYKDLKVIAAASGTNSKNYIEKLVTDHVEKKKAKKAMYYKLTGG